jgi:hypothetical protein
MKDTTLGKYEPYFVVGNAFFLSNEILDCRGHNEQVQNNNLQNQLKQQAKTDVQK